MSSGLYWAPTHPEDHRLSSDLKFLFREMYGEPVKVKLTMDNEKELRAARAATPHDDIKTELMKLLKMIEKYGEILVEEKH